MRHHTILFIILTLFLVIGAQSQASAAPVQQDENLLLNPSFEQPYVDGTADSWTTWHMETEKTDSECLSGYHYEPKWNMETTAGFVQNAIASQYVGNNWDTWGGGVAQTVDVTPGGEYRFSFYAKGRTTNEPSPAASDVTINQNIRAGIDPNGSGLWDDADVVWGPSSSAHDNWQQFSIQATATGDKMTVFTSADLGVVGWNQCREYLDIWFDTAELLLVGAPPPTEPEATAAPADPPPTAPQSTGGATICVNAFNDVNADGLPSPNEGFMPGVTFTVASQDAIIGSVISDGSPNAACFYNLTPGRFQVAQQVPAHLEMTSAANVAIEATAANTVSVAFGSRVRGEPIAEATPAAEDGETGDPVAPGSGGMICVNAFHDENADGVNDPNEGYMAGVTLSVVSGSEQIGQILSTGSDSPTCFNDLAPGSYEASQQVSGRLEMTTAESVALALTEGQATLVEFGSRVQMDSSGSAPDDGESDTGTEEGADDGGSNILPIAGLAAIILGVVLLGALIFYLLRR